MTPGRTSRKFKLGLASAAVAAAIVVAGVGSSGGGSMLGGSSSGSSMSGRSSGSSLGRGHHGSGVGIGAAIGLGMAIGSAISESERSRPPGSPEPRSKPKVQKRAAIAPKSECPPKEEDKPCRQYPESNDVDQVAPPRSDAVDAADECNLLAGHVVALVELAKDQGWQIIVRCNKRAALKWYRDKSVQPKPASLDKKTDGCGIVRDDDNKRYHSDIDLYLVLRKGPNGFVRENIDPADSPAFIKKANEYLRKFTGIDKEWIRHADQASLMYTGFKWDKDNKPVSDSDKPLFGRMAPGKFERFLVTEADGKIRIICGAENLKRYNDLQKQEYPYTVATKGSPPLPYSSYGSSSGSSYGASSLRPNSRLSLDSSSVLGKLCGIGRTVAAGIALGVEGLLVGAQPGYCADVPDNLHNCVQIDAIPHTTGDLIGNTTYRLHNHCSTEWKYRLCTPGGSPSGLILNTAPKVIPGGTDKQEGELEVTLRPQIFVVGVPNATGSVQPPECDTTNQAEIATPPATASEGATPSTAPQTISIAGTQIEIPKPSPNDVVPLLRSPDPSKK